MFLPAAGFLIEGAHQNGDAGFTGYQRKTLDLHVFKVGPIGASFLVTEDILTSKRFSARYYPYRIAYTMDYFYLYWLFAGSTVGLMADHICYNVIDAGWDTDFEQLRWYGLGLRWESWGMKTGMKDGLPTIIGPDGFSLIRGLQYAFYAGVPMHTERFKYTSIIRGALRLDVARLYGMVPYFQFAFQGLADRRIRFDRYAEAGLRFTAYRLTVTPFASWAYRHDALLYEGDTDSSWSFGIRGETLLGDGARGTAPGEERDALAGPEFHFAGGYGKHFASEHLGFLTELGVSLDFVRYGGTAFTFISDLEHNSTADGNALYPRYLHLALGGGVDHYIANNLFAGLHYVHERRHDGNEYRGHAENLHQIQVRAGTAGMRRGCVHFEREGPAFLNRFEWLLQMGSIVEGKGSPYRRTGGAALRWEVARFFAAVPYVALEMKLFDGRERQHEWSAESGLRIHSGLLFVLYHRYERAADIDRYGGAVERGHMIGVRVER